MNAQPTGYVAIETFPYDWIDEFGEAEFLVYPVLRWIVGPKQADALILDSRRIRRASHSDDPVLFVANEPAEIQSACIEWLEWQMKQALANERKRQGITMQMRGKVTIICQNIKNKETKADGF